MRKLNKCINYPLEPFSSLMQCLLNWKNGSFGPQANIKKYFTALTKVGDLFIFKECVGIYK